MKKWFKKTMAVILTTAMAMSVSVPAFAENNLPYGDIYAQNFSETVTYEGVEYTYNYGYNDNGDKTISVYDSANNSTNVLTYDEKNSVVYLNNQTFAKVNNKNNDLTNRNAEVTPYGSWQFIGSESTYIEWDTARDSAALAVLIAGALTLTGLFAPQIITASLVLSSIGPLTVAAWIGISGGGTANLSLYQMVEFGTVQYKVEWSMRVNNKTYPCTPIGWVANPYYSLDQNGVA